MNKTKRKIDKILENRPLFFAAYKLFHKTFRLPFQDFMDSDLTMLMCKPVLDIYKFDDWLHGKFGEYEEDGLSMFDVLEAHYGEAVAMRIKELMG